MGLPELDNLVRIGQLKAEPRNAQEVTRMLAVAQTWLLFGKAYPKVQTFIRHAQSFGDFNHAVPSFGHLLDGLSFEFCWISDSHHFPFQFRP